jgi:ornithine carbamoyltransferase
MFEDEPLLGERLTKRAQKAVKHAQDEACRLRHPTVSPEHILLGILRESDSVAVHILLDIGLKPDLIRYEISRYMQVGTANSPTSAVLGSEAKRVIELAYDEANRLGEECVGTEHLLLGIVSDGRSTASRVLAKLGVNLKSLRNEVASLRGAGSNQPAESDRAMKASSTMEDIGTFMKGRDLLSIRDLSVDEVWEIFRIASKLKSMPLEEQIKNPLLHGKTLAMIFEKPSLRTRVTFEVGMNQLGGHAVYLAPQDIQMGKRESVADVARNLSRWVHGIMARVFAHQTVMELAKYASVPVINGLSDLEHPCQALADVFTIYEKKGELKGLKIAYIGDGCNTCHSLMLLAAKVGADIVVGCPEGYEPDVAILTAARRDAKESGSKIAVVNDPFEAAEGADVIYTDVWASMGLEAEAEQRRQAFQRFQVNKELVDVAAADVIVLHCLPAHRGEEITDDVIDGPKSVVLDEAENRLHVQKAIMSLVM